ncbi:hypothetical protein J2S11_001888 [Bacillus horti]|uniref:Hydrolase n=1 Tax=Caldalkalibacillus horti TaxID=77523 RepID=A0ABT9VYE2_9BACI|nr:hypothetical protein [Bacillus horti]
MIIANRIAERLSIEDRTAFLFGSIAPDAVSTKDISHFFKGDVQDYTRYIDYKGFLERYSSHANDLFILGYYTHLIADDIWLKGFYLPWLRNRLEADKGLLEVYHNDFRLLNGMLLKYYGCTDELKNQLSFKPEILDIHEVSANNVERFIPYVLGDLEYNKQDIDAKLNVFTLNQIIGYIETSIDIGLLNMNKILHNKK